MENRYSTVLAQDLIYKEFAHISSNYFNTAYFGPSPYRVRKKATNAIFKELDPSFYRYHSWMGIPDRVRKLIARILNCSSDSIAHDTSVTDIIHKLIEGLSLTSEDRVCVVEGDYPSNILPWMHAQKRYDFKLHRLKAFQPDLDFLKKNIPEGTKYLNLSHIAFDSGRKVSLTDLGQLAKERGIFLIIDATQSLGGIQITKKELASIDVLACSTYKWLLGPYGHAFAYFSKNALDKINYQSGNWQASINSRFVHNLVQYTTETLNGARRLDRGQTPNMLNMACLEGSLELFLELGLENIEQHNREIRNFFLENFPKKKYDLVTPIDPQYMGNILSLKAHSVDPLTLESELQHKNFDVSVREGKIRISFHLFNSFDQVKQLVELLDSI
jgi:selenocysteine lyase/cysteine desulfurase